MSEECSYKCLIVAKFIVKVNFLCLFVRVKALVELRMQVVFLGLSTLSVVGAVFKCYCRPKV